MDWASQTELQQLRAERDDLLVMLANTAAERDDLAAELRRYQEQRLVGHP